MGNELIPSDSSIPWVIFTHPNFPKRIRFDLLSNGVLGLNALLGEKLYPVGDLSTGGCSYLLEIPSSNKFQSLRQTEDWVEQHSSGLIDQQVALKFFFETNPSKGGVGVVATLKNYRLFLALSTEEIEREVTKYFFAKGIKRKHDPGNVFGKLDVMIMKAMATRSHPKTYHHALLAINVSFINLLAEAGVSDEEILEIYRGFSNKRVFIKYGLEFDDPAEAKTLLEFAHPKALFERNKPKAPAPKAEPETPGNPADSPSENPERT